jgi:hypothetical protein
MLLDIIPWRVPTIQDATRAPIKYFQKMWQFQAVCLF